MARVISALFSDMYVMENGPLFGLAVSDDDFEIVPPADRDKDYFAPMVNDYTHRFAEQPADAEERFRAAIYNSPYVLTEYEDSDRTLEDAVASLADKIGDEA